MGGVVTYDYDAVGNQIEMTDPAGNTTRYCYDAVKPSDRGFRGRWRKDCI